MNTTHRGQAITVLSVVCFMTIVSVALLSIGRELHFSESGLRWVVTAHGLTFGGLLLLGGRPPGPTPDLPAGADRLHRRLARLRARLERHAHGCDARGAGHRCRDRAAGRALDRDELSMFGQGVGRNKALGVWGGLGAAGVPVGRRRTTRAEPVLELADIR
jgi:hypothetical protein